MDDSQASAHWERVLRAEEIDQTYYADRSQLPGVTVFTSQRADAPEFDLAVVYRVPTGDADAVLAAVVRHLRERGRRPRVRLTPLSTPRDWPERLRRHGFVEVAERHVFIELPVTARLPANPEVVVRRATSPEDADLFSTILVAGYEVPAVHQEWDRMLARRHLAAGGRSFYLAWLDGQAVGAASSVHHASGVTSLYVLTTLPVARRHGVATSLLARMAGDARSAGSRAVFGVTDPAGGAIELYERLGFVRLFETRTFVQLI
jgi:predicted GNAT family acetyltransferase